jgi:hypothetical protein
VSRVRESAPLVDALNGNTLRIVEHDGWVYFEITAKHAGDIVVVSTCRVNRDTAMPVLRRLVLA